ncbi:MAG: ATP-binding protein [Limnohabitans sp.]|nr:ATP-binding protein [Limnohabitans sp.]
MLDSNELVMARFINPESGDGPYILRECLNYHSPKVDDFIFEILQALSDSKTVIVDLGSANEQIIRYFAKTLSVAVFGMQENKFVNSQLKNKLIQISFEEAHIIFSLNSGNVIDVYSRFAKEGAKFHIGIVYSTQSPSTVNQDLLAQTENFFIGHLSSPKEVGILANMQFAFKGMELDIMKSRTPGFMRVLTFSHRYPISIQTNRYTGHSYAIKESIMINGS